MEGRGDQGKFVGRARMAPPRYWKDKVLMNDKVGFGVIGCGSIAPWHAGSVLNVRDAELVAVCDIIEDRANALAASHDSPKVYIDYKQQTTIMTLELHLGGKYIMRFEGYTPHKVHVKREPEFRARISWNPKTREAIVDQAVFGPDLYFLAPDYYAERGIRWRVPPVVPKQQFATGDAKALLMEPSGLRYVDYHREPGNLYGRGAEKQVKHLNYLPFDTREYLPDKFKVREEFLDKREQSP